MQTGRWRADKGGESEGLTDRQVGDVPVICQLSLELFPHDALRDTVIMQLGFFIHFEAIELARVQHAIELLESYLGSFGFQDENLTGACPTGRVD